jgi:hypothetical protein
MTERAAGGRRPPKAARRFGYGVAGTIDLVFPFDFGDTSFDWPLVTRVLLALAVLGSIAGLVANAVSLGGALRGPELDPVRRRH